MSPIFKGPIFVSHRTATKRQRALTDLPVARGVVNEQDFLQESGRATRDEVKQWKDRESHEQASS
jgi:hypothetical protein